MLEYNKNNFLYRINLLFIQVNQFEHMGFFKI